MKGPALLWLLLLGIVALELVELLSMWPSPSRETMFCFNGNGTKRGLS